MKVLFVIGDDFPYSGACTSLLNNLLLTGFFDKNDIKIEVLAVKSKLSKTPVDRFGNIVIHNLTLMSKVSKNEYVNLFKYHPFKTVIGLLKKFITVNQSVNIKNINVSEIEKKIKQLSVVNFDAVFAVMGDFEIAKAIAIIKNKQPELKTVLYQVDPCSTNDVLKKKGCINEYIKLENELYYSYDKIVTTPIIIDEARNKYPEEVLNKMVPMEFPNVVPNVKKPEEYKDKIRCVFTGSIYADFRDPTYTLRLFNALDQNVNLEIIGKVKTEYRKSFEEYGAYYHGEKSLEETKQELILSDFLVNIGNKMTNQVPSKIFEYISYGKPIVNVCKNRECPTIPYLKKYPLALNLYEEDEIFDEQVQLLKQFISASYNERIPESDILIRFKKCTPDYCAELLCDILNDL